MSEEEIDRMTNSLNNLKKEIKDPTVILSPKEYKMAKKYLGMGKAKIINGIPTCYYNGIKIIVEKEKIK